MTKKKNSKEKSKKEEVIPTLNETQFVEENPIVEIKDPIVDKQENTVENDTKQIVESIEPNNVAIESNKVWTTNWQELVKVEGVQQTLRGKQYYGVKKK